jgi:hypothetical protein
VVESFLRMEAQGGEKRKLSELVELARAQPPDRQSLLVRMLEEMSKRLEEGLNN